MEQDRETLNIPHILLTFNLPTYLKQAILWYKWYYPENEIFVIDNGNNAEETDCKVFRQTENKCAFNLKQFIDTEIKGKYEYYTISDVDIMPHPATPPNFLEVFKNIIEQGFHHAGFGLITHDVPDWNEQKAFLNGVENDFRKPEMEHKFNFEGKDYTGFKAPIDTTFAMYTTKNSGWHAPMDGADWGNSVRIFDAFHLPWYQNPEYINSEMDSYFKSAKYWGDEDSNCSAGVNHYRPAKYNK